MNADDGESENCNQLLDFERSASHFQYCLYVMLEVYIEPPLKDGDLRDTHIRLTVFALFCSYSPAVV
ncbi:hypothetical protein OUZ56_008533 [Daphnia magna]|uniref:Uncharacterized protein n=1 Tax=Daphnia magna TaxID=35525 RepID=A0ABR0AD98_9CRUS|nr:hypothetical protein OUZ56_008533 [Daphnia magna]